LGRHLKLHLAIQGTTFGGVDPGVSPRTALAVGLKVDLDSLPEAFVQQIKEGKIDLDDPAALRRCRLVVIAYYPQIHYLFVKRCA